MHLINCIDDFELGYDLATNLSEHLLNDLIIIPPKVAAAENYILPNCIVRSNSLWSKILHVEFDVKDFKAK